MVDKSLLEVRRQKISEISGILLDWIDDCKKKILFSTTPIRPLKRIFGTRFNLMNKSSKVSNMLHPKTTMMSTKTISEPGTFKKLS